jgi:hypothetical protein
VAGEPGGAARFVTGVQIETGGTTAKTCVRTRRRQIQLRRSIIVCVSAGVIGAGTGDEEKAARSNQVQVESMIAHEFSVRPALHANFVPAATVALARNAPAFLSASPRHGLRILISDVDSPHCRSFLNRCAAHFRDSPEFAGAGHQRNRMHVHSVEDLSQWKRPTI